jgi:hypothetical protein
MRERSRDMCNGEQSPDEVCSKETANALHVRFFVNDRVSMF